MCDERMHPHDPRSGHPPCIPREITIVVTIEGLTCPQQPQVARRQEPERSSPEHPSDALDH